MNENLKLVIIALGILAVYHFFFRSVTPTPTTSGNGDSIADGLTDAPDFRGIDEAPITQVPDGRTSIATAGSRSAVDGGNEATISSRGITTVLER